MAMCWTACQVLGKGDMCVSVSVDSKVVYVKGGPQVSLSHCGGGREAFQEVVWGKAGEVTFLT